MANERTLNKLRRIYELAIKGVGGEKSNAQAMLEKLLLKHGMSLDELTNSEEQVYEYYFPYRTDFERILILQIVAKVQDNHKISAWRYGRKKHVHVELTPSEFFEVDMLYGLYKRAWEAELEVTITAFLSVNNIFPESENPDPNKKSDPMSDEEIEALLAKMKGMRPVPVHKQLEA